ncbi:MAG: CHRD domain-containing protein [Thermoanaerobaculia bacterium]
MKSRALRLAFAIGLALAPRAWAGSTFEAVLVGSNEVPGPGISEGSFDAEVVVEGTKVSLTLTPKGLRGWMSAHIHKGAAGVAGRLIAEFPWESGDSSPRTYVGSVSEKVAADMAASPENYYVHVHLPNFPAGGARGQLAQQPLLAQVQAVGQRPPPPAAGISRPLPPPGIGEPNWAGPAPRRQFRSPSASTYAFFFSRLADLDESAGDDEAAGLDPDAAEKRQREAHAAGLTEREGAILKEVAFDCNRALAPLDAKIRASVNNSPWLESSQLWQERSGIAEPCVVRLRARLGEAAFANLDTYVGDHFGAAPDAQQAPQLSPKRAQTIKFPAARSKVYRDGDFRLDASASSGLRVYFTGSGDCTVYGSTVHILSAGKCWVTAHQPGDARFEAAPDLDQLIPIAKAGQRIAGAAPETKTYLDPDFPLGMSATSGLDVVFFAWGDCTVNGSYIHITGAGSCSLTAHQPGDSNYLAAQIIDQQFPIAKADQTIDFAGLSTSYTGPLDLPLNASASSGLPVTYSAWGTCSMLGSSTLRMLDSGECSVTADQGGDRNFNAAPSVKRTFQIYVPPPPS